MRRRVLPSRAAELFQEEDKDAPPCAAVRRVRPRLHAPCSPPGARDVAARTSHAGRRQDLARRPPPGARVVAARSSSRQIPSGRVPAARSSATSAGDPVVNQLCGGALR
jgi:hypothetical protein